MCACPMTSLKQMVMAEYLFLKTQQVQHKLSSLTLELLVFVNEMEQLTQGSSELGSWMEEEENHHALDDVRG